MSMEPESSFTDQNQGPARKKPLRKLWGRIRDFIFANRQHSLRESVTELIREHSNDESLGEGEREMLENFVGFRDIKASEVMVPRTDIIGVSIKATYKEVRELVLKEGHTRIPVYKESLDEIVGFIHVKDLIAFVDKPKSFAISKIMREIVYSPRSVKVIDLLAKMRKAATHIAIILDEYGGTDGLVTIEDMVEEIIGEIKDEHDASEEPNYIVALGDGKFKIDGRAKVEDVEECLLVSISNEDGEYETFGGFILSYLGYIPKVGEQIQYQNGIDIEILEADERRIKSTTVVVKAKDISN